MIRFGSRVDLYLPLSTVKVTVSKGEKVRAGETVLGYLASTAGSQRRRTCCLTHQSIVLYFQLKSPDPLLQYYFERTGKPDAESTTPEPP